MKKIWKYLFNILLFSGVFLFFAAFVIAVLAPENMAGFLFLVLPLIATAIGILILIVTFISSKKGWHLFTSLMLMFWGIFFFLRQINIIRSNITQFWPILGVTAGIFLFVSGMYRYKKVKFGYAIPSLSLFLFGLWLCLFSFGIITVPFKYVALAGGPLLFIMACIFIVALFLLQKKYRQLIAKDDERDSFEDESPVYFGEDE